MVYLVRFSEEIYSGLLTLVKVVPPIFVVRAILKEKPIFELGTT